MKRNIVTIYFILAEITPFDFITAYKLRPLRFTNRKSLSRFGARHDYPQKRRYREGMALETSLSIKIVGGGIAGLMSAVTLRRGGHSVEVWRI